MTTLEFMVNTFYALLGVIFIGIAATVAAAFLIAIVKLIQKWRD